MNKQSIRANTKELYKIVNAQIDGLFSSKSSGVDGRTLRKLANRKIISLMGYDTKQQVNIYQISKHQMKNVLEVLEVT